MRELSLFSGAGGGLLGSLLLGWEPVGYVEFNEYCQRVIAQRIADGILPNAPIFTDVREFVQSGAAREYRGFADVVTGGFPCQPFSVAGKRAGADDPRNMWPATLDTVRAVRPRFCFFENVPGLLNSGYFERILCDLTESGYSVRWRCLSAAEVGAPHKRDRLWIVAYTENGNARQPDIRKAVDGIGTHCAGIGSRLRDESSRCGSPMAYTEREQGHAQRRDSQPRWDALGRHTEAAQCQDGQADTDGLDGCGSALGNTTSAGLSHRRGAQMGEPQPQPQLKRSGGEMAYTNGKGQQQSWPVGSGAEHARAEPRSDRGQWWEVEPNVGRVVDGLSDWLDFA